MPPTREVHERLGYYGRETAMYLWASFTLQHVSTAQMLASIRTQERRTKSYASYA